jgi:hypothetical protein
LRCQELTAEIVNSISEAVMTTLEIVSRALFGETEKNNEQTVRMTVGRAEVLVSHSGGLGSSPGEVIWDLWWTKWS